MTRRRRVAVQHPELNEWALQRQLATFSLKKANAAFLFTEKAQNIVALWPADRSIALSVVQNSVRKSDENLYTLKIYDISSEMLSAERL